MTNDQCQRTNGHPAPIYRCVTELCADHPNLMEYIVQLEREEDRLAESHRDVVVDLLDAQKERDQWRALARELAAALALLEWADTKEMFVTAAPAEECVDNLLERYQQLADKE